MTAAFITFAIIVGTGLLVGWHERHAAKAEARKRHPASTNWRPNLASNDNVSRARFDHDSQAIDVTRDVDVLVGEIESYLRGRTPRW